MIERKKKIGIVCCSNGMKRSYSTKIKALEEALLSIGLRPVFSDYIYEKSNVYSSTGKERARALMNFYSDDEIEEIFDISGGDLANGILPYLDYEVIANSKKRFWGYSDLTTVLNAIYAKTEKSSVLYQIRNIISEYKEQQMADVKYALNDGSAYLFKLRYQFVQGSHMRGIVIGGNIRCFLKLAGTEYMPDFQDKILLLESRSGLVPQMETYLTQLQQLGAFDKIAGILLGTFTQMEENREMQISRFDAEGGNTALPQESLFDYPTMADLIRGYVDENMPIAVTKDIGHGKDAKAIVIGQHLEVTLHIRQPFEIRNNETGI